MPHYMNHKGEWNIHRLTWFIHFLTNSYYSLNEILDDSEEPFIVNLLRIVQPHFRLYGPFLGFFKMVSGIHSKFCILYFER